MPDYEVTITEKEIYVVNVFAHSQEEAQDKAREFLDSNEREKFHVSSDGESSCVEI